MVNNSIVKKDIEQLIQSSYIDWDCFKNKNFYITGATGLVGSILTATLATKKVRENDLGKIYILVRSRVKALSIFNQLEFENYIVPIVGDVNEVVHIEDSIDYIIHTASVTTSKYMVTNPVETLMTSIVGTDNTLKLAVEKNVKGYLYLSSMEMYGTTTIDQNPITEDKLGYIDVLNVRSSYSEGKRACENLCAGYSREYGVPVKIARLAQTFGAGVEEKETKVFASFAKNALKGEDIILHTKGETLGNYCYTRDCVGALLCLLTRGKNGDAYTVVNDRNSMYIKEMAKVVAETLSNGKSCVAFDIPDDQLKYGYAPETKMRLCGDKMKSLGWQPQVDMPEMYQLMVDAWREEGK